MTGFEKFYSEYENEVREIARQRNWNGHGSSREYDVMLLPDGTSDDTEIAESQYFDALRSWQERLGISIP